MNFDKINTADRNDQSIRVQKVQAKDQGNLFYNSHFLCDVNNAINASRQIRQSKTQFLNKFQQDRLQDLEHSLKNLHNLFEEWNKCKVSINKKILKLDLLSNETQLKLDFAIDLLRTSNLNSEFLSLLLNTFLDRDLHFLPTPK